MGGKQQQQQNELLTKGSLVEVCTDEEGFKGAWFEAVIVDPDPPSYPRSASKKKNAKVYVEYQTLLSDDGHNRLREFVNPDFIRPRPPSHTAKGFELYDTVDAFYKDVWWTGVVTRLLDSSRYVVSFGNPPDELEFGLSDLRFHRRWLNGKWVKPQKQETAGLPFQVGKNVEVSFDRDDCRDVWFPSNIIKDCGNGSYVVNYGQTDAGNENKLIIATVDANHIRPCPPLIKNKSFDLLDKVDAFYDFGWWFGVVNKVLADSSYVVVFQHLKKEKVLNHSDLRSHLNWKDGKWYTSQGESIHPYCTFDEGDIFNDLVMSKSEVQPDSQNITNETFGDKMSISDEERNEQPTVSIKKPSTARVSAMKRKQNPKLPNEGISTQSPYLNKCKKMEDECETQTDEIPCFPSPTAEDTLQNILISIAADQLSDQSSQGNTAQGKHHKVDEHGSVSGPQRKRGRPAKKKVKDPQFPAQGKSSNQLENAAESYDAEVPIITGLEIIPLMGSSGTIKPLVSSGNNCPYPTVDASKQTSINPALDDIQESNEGTLTCQKRKRGRPPKALVITPATPVMERPAPHNADLIESQRENMESEHMVGNMTFAEVSNEKKCATTTKTENFTPPRGKRKIFDVLFESQISGSVKTCMEENAELPSTERIVGEVPSNGVDDEPISKLFEQMNTQTGVDGSRFTPASNVEESTGMGQAIITSSDAQGFPFVKNTALWDTIESMDVFQKTPQKPHFLPLAHSKDSCREGLAIGYMVTFASIVDKACRLEIDGPKRNIEEMLETLGELGLQGFDVEPVRGRLNEMLLYKDKQEKLQDLLSKTCTEMEKHNIEKVEIDQMVEDIRKQISELQKSLSHAVSKKEAKEADIASAQGRLGEINEEIRLLHLDYEALVCKPF